MKSVEDVEQFNQDLLEKYGADNPRVGYYTACYESCIPKSFWDVRGEQVTHNTAAFKIVLKYCSRRKKAMRNGYGLLFSGDNGVGKTFFTSFVLTQMIRRGCSVYYTSLAQLDIDIKKGFHDKVAERRLELLTSADFLAIDEVGKEHFRSDSYLNTRLELLLKTRYDDSDPTIISTNLDYNALCEMYGATLTSMFDGKYAKVFLETGDFRRKLSAKMKKDLGF